MYVGEGGGGALRRATLANSTARHVDQKLALAMGIMGKSVQIGTLKPMSNVRHDAKYHY